MMARSFHPPLVSWGGAATKRRPSTPQEPSPEDDADAGDDLKKPASASDSDHETASASSSEPATARAAAGGVAGGVASSFARAGKLLWGGARNPLSGLASSLTKQHSRTVSDFSETDFTTPFAPGTPVWTRYGLGTVVVTRADDGFLVVTLQGLGRMTLYLNPADEDYYSVPAIRHDWVETPAGEGLVVGFDAKQQTYRVRLSGTGARSNVDVNVHRSDLRRVMPVRRQTHAPPQPKPAAAQQEQQQQSEAATATAHATSHSTPAAHEGSALAKGLNSALKTIVTTSSGLTNSLSSYYYQGQCVITTFGQGTIVALDQTSHRAQVQLTWGAMAFLSTDAVLHYTKALVGMNVTTAKFGAGVVTDMRPADGIYTVKLHAATESGQHETVYVHESDLVRGSSGAGAGAAARRLRLGAAPKQITDKIGASTTKLFSVASSTVKMFGHGAAAAAAAVTTPSTNGKASPSPASSNTVKTPAPSRSKSVRVEENDEPEVSSAGI